MGDVREVYQYEDKRNSRMSRLLLYSSLLLMQGWLVLTLGLAQRYLNTVEAAGPEVVTPIVLGASTFGESDEDLDAVAPVEPTATPLPQPTAVAESTTSEPESTTKPQPPKDSYTIAVIGDSFVDTMGERMEYLEHALTAAYPDVEFKLYNYGIGSQNAEDVMVRFHDPLNYVDRDYPAIGDVKPDVIIVGSTGYNVFSPYFLDRHWLALTHLVQEAKKITPHVYMLAEIAPLREGFTKGPGGPNYDTATAVRASGEVAEQVQNALRLSPVLNVPTIDAYTPSLASNRPEGKSEYVNSHDGLHPSVAGHEFMAKTIVEKIQLP